MDNQQIWHAKPNTNVMGMINGKRLLKTVTSEMRLYLYAPLRSTLWVVNEPFWFWGHWIKGQGNRVKYANIIIDKLLRNAFSPFLKLGPLSFLCSRITLLILGHWVKGQGHHGQMCQYRFWSITRESPYLKLGPHIVSGQQRNSHDVGVTRSNIKVTRSNVPKLFQIV